MIVVAGTWQDGYPGMSHGRQGAVVGTTSINNYYWEPGWDDTDSSQAAYRSAAGLYLGPAAEHWCSYPDR
jgi:hypothetical protein